MLGLFLKTSAVFAEQFNEELMATDVKSHLMVEISLVFLNLDFAVIKSI